MYSTRYIIFSLFLALAPDADHPTRTLYNPNPNAMEWPVLGCCVACEVDAVACERSTSRWQFFRYNAIRRWGVHEVCMTYSISPHPGGDWIFPLYRLPGNHSAPYIYKQRRNPRSCRPVLPSVQHAVVLAPLRHFWSLKTVRSTLRDLRSKVDKQCPTYCLYLVPPTVYVVPHTRYLVLVTYE